jgi:hypothetical protein
VSSAPILIEPRGDSYRVSRGDELLLVVPRELFDTYAQDSVFPPSWPDSTGDAHPVRRLYWNPATRQFLMAGLERHSARVVEGHGHTAYRSFLQGFWVPQPPLLLLRPFWNPPDPYAAFDRQARAESLHLQLRFHQLLAQMRPPRGWTAALNATDAYLEALGITAEDGSRDPEAIHELSLMPAQALGHPPTMHLLDALAQEHVKAVFPLLRHGSLVGLHTLGLGARHGAEALLQTSGTDYHPGPPRPH